jgi:hypothetical protein
VTVAGFPQIIAARGLRQAQCRSDKPVRAGGLAAAGSGAGGRLRLRCVIIDGALGCDSRGWVLPRHARADVDLGGRLPLEEEVSSNLFVPGAS